MFAGQSFMPLMGQLRLAQTPSPGQTQTPAAPAPAPAPAAPAPVAAAPAPIVTSGLSHGTQVAIAATLAGLSILGAVFLTD